MNKRIIKNILKKYVINESLIYNDTSFIDETNEIKKLNKDDSKLESKLDKIWNSIEIKLKKSGGDMSKFKSDVNDKIKYLVDKLSKKGKNPSVWIRRKIICDLWV